MGRGIDGSFVYRHPGGGIHEIPLYILQLFRYRKTAFRSRAGAVLLWLRAGADGGAWGPLCADLQPGKPVILEFKVQDEEEKDIERERIRKYGFAFCGRRC